MSDPVRVAVVGVTGYAGYELARLLLRHPHIEKPTFFLREAHANVHCLTDLFPQLRGWGDAPCRPLSVEAIATSGARGRIPFDASRGFARTCSQTFRCESQAADRGPQRRISFSQRGDIHEVVQTARARCEGLVGNGIRTARAIRGRASESTRRWKSGVLSHVGNSRTAAADRSGLDQHCARDRMRLQVRRHRRGQRTEARHAFRRSKRKFPGV